ncbi:MAG TPA: ADOP family duplicated permease, partial [Longimicrobiales bacterium]|nr:ADOP family duplicated permease [Longimicrobiales bacterium]
THASWVTRFGSDPTVLGRTLEVDDITTEVVGVLPEGFAFPDPDAVVMLPLTVDPDGPFGTFGTSAIARLAPGVTLDEARERTTQLQSRLTDFFPDLEQTFLDQAGWNVTVERYQDFMVGDDVASALWVVFGTVGFVFLIACANVANLFLVRAESRQKELAVRAAMGAGYARIAGGFLSEAFLLGVGGGAVGLALAWGGVRLLTTYGPQNIPRLDEVAVDGATLAFAVALALGATLLFGAFPLLRFAGGALAGLLRDGGRANTAGVERHRTRNALVAAQLALALVLLVGSGLMLRSFQRLRAVDPGIDATDVLTVGMSLGEGVENAQAAAFYQQVADEVAALPGVASVGLSTFVPIGGGSSNGGSFYIENEPRDEGALPPVAMYKAVGADYLTAMGQRLLRGRDLTRADWEGGAPVALVNKAFEDKFLGGDAVGKGIKWDSAAAFARVVGVVTDVREINLKDDPGPWAYLPMVVGAWGYPHMDASRLLIKTGHGASVPVEAVRAIVARLNPTVPLTSIRTMDEILSQEMSGLSFTMVLLGIAAGVALFLGAIGLFGVISYVVSQRTREIGVRVALGARGEDIQSMVFRQSAKVAVAGVTLGLLGAAALTRLMGAVLYGVSATDPLSFLVAPALLVVVAFTATWLPARRASRVDPVVALRAE